MKFSIVTVSYNQAKFLERTILSVLNQKFSNLEYIIVDPGSTDGSRETIQKYSKHFTHIIYEPDQGPADGLNKGFSRATGDIFGFLNSDDVFLDGCLQKVCDFFQKNRTVDVVSGNAYIIDINDKKIRNGYSDRFSLPRFAYNSAFLMQPSTFFKASTFKQTSGFNISNKTAWDAELFVDMCTDGAKFTLINSYLSGYRLHSTSVTSLQTPHEENYRIFREYIFKKIMNREKYFYDILIRNFFRFMRYVDNPRDIYERITKGPISGRFSPKIEQKL